MSTKYRPFTKIDPTYLMLAPIGEIKAFIDVADGYLKGKDETGAIVNIVPPVPVSYDNVVIQLIAGESITANQLVMINGSGEAMKAVPIEANHDRIIGFCKADAMIGTPIQIVTHGHHTHGSLSLTPGSLYYAGSTAGTITTTEPVTGVVIPIGVAQTSTGIIVNIGTPIVLI